jgi:hypothetical protein
MRTSLAARCSLLAARCSLLAADRSRPRPGWVAQLRASSFAALLIAGVSGQQTATVYRDVNGMPHIVTNNEATAWYALGYEQARDALLWIQMGCKAAKGELTWARGISGITGDFAVKVFNTHGRLAAMSVAQRRALFAPTNPGIQANFYDNCVAYAAGADAYRQAVENAPATPLTAERRLRNWLTANALPEGQPNLAWVYQTPIEALDVAAHGPFTSAVMSFAWPTGMVNSVGASYASLQGGGATSDVEPLMLADPLSPENSQRWLDEVRQRLATVPGAATAFSGSNTFAWSGLYCKDATGPTTYAGLLGDPHQEVPLPTPNFNAEFLRNPNHLWFAHVKVTPQGVAQPSLDLLGHFPHAAAAPFTSHNRSIALGGTLGSPNYLDTFLLRLEEGAGGFPAPAYHYYSQYHDTTPPTNASWRPIVTSSISIKLWSGQSINLPYWRVDSYGVVFPTQESIIARILGGPVPEMPVVYGERVVPGLPAPRWRAGIPSDPQRMRFWSEPQTISNQLVTSPMVVALRAPIDSAVAGEDKHLQLLRDFWEMAHATQVSDVVSRTNGGAYSANLCVVDRSGSTFTSVLSAIPQRGQDSALFAAGYRTLDKWAIYTRGFGPVPARHSDDKMFDWVFGTTGTPDKPAPLFYLTYPTDAPPVNNTTGAPSFPFKPMTWQVQSTGAAFPPTAYPATGSFRIESGFFASACNDMVWGFSRKRDILGWTLGPGLGSFNNVTADNTLFQWALNSGVAYATPLIGLEGPPNQLAVVSRLTRVAERIIRGAPAGLPPMTPAQMCEFVVQPEMYRESSYVPPTGVTTYVSAMPTPVRQWKEVVDHPGLSGTTESPLVAAQRELTFFTDLWAALYNGLWASHSVVGTAPTSPQNSPSIVLDLRDLWVKGSVASLPALQNQIFWYDDPYVPASIRWIELPADFPLIDFYWRESEVSNGVTAGSVNPNGLSSAELGALTALVNDTLVPWDAVSGAHYRNVPTSTGACLLEMTSQRFNARGAQFGRHWMRLRRGQVEFAGSGWIPLTAQGSLPGGVGSRVLRHQSWSPLRAVAFPPTQLATLFRGAGVKVPYSALYDATGQVKSVLEPKDTNALVKFFLQLGNHYVEPAANGGNPSRKKARFELLDSSGDRFLNEGYPATYPLTDGLQRLVAVRAVLDTAAYLEPISTTDPLGIPAFGQCFRSRAYDRDGQVWPALVPPQTRSDAECVGAGLRAVTWTASRDPGLFVADRGLQPLFFGLGGSIASMVALFPSVGVGVDSRYWSTPGLEVMGCNPTLSAAKDPLRYDRHMSAFASGVLLPTYYDDFMNHVAWSIDHSY